MVSEQLWEEKIIVSKLNYSTPNQFNIFIDHIDKKVKQNIKMYVNEHILYLFCVFYVQNYL